jgi:hypothetical protein
MEGLEWTDREESRPGVPPVLTQAGAEGFFPMGIRFLRAHPRLAHRRHALLAQAPPALRALEKAERHYSDDMPKSAMGEAHEWNECRAAAETLMALGKAYRALIMEEES